MEANSTAASTMTEPSQSRRFQDPRQRAQVFAAARNRTKTSLVIIPPDPIKVIDPARIELGDSLGTGSFSCGFEIKTIDNQKCENLVMKKLRGEVLRNPLVFAACAADLRQEGRVLASLCHPNIIEIQAWSGEEMIEKYMKGSNDSSYLILDRLTETLDHRISKWSKQNPNFMHRFSEEKREAYARLQEEKYFHVISLARAIDHCHGHNIVHRDLKPPNVGFDQGGCLKVFDFDLARLLPSNHHDKFFKLTANVGSPRYMAPEVRSGKPYNIKSDVFSFSIMVYQMMTSKTPYGNMEREWGFANKGIPTSWSSEIRILLKRCLSRVIGNRPDMRIVRSMLETEVGLFFSLDESENRDSNYTTHITEDFALESVESLE
jgi:serine/threonine protein kinase